MSHVTWLRICVELDAGGLPLRGSPKRGTMSCSSGAPRITVWDGFGMTFSSNSWGNKWLNLLKFTSICRVIVGVLPLCSVEIDHQAPTKMYPPFARGSCTWDQHISVFRVYFFRVKRVKSGARVDPEIWLFYFSIKLRMILYYYYYHFIMMILMIYIHIYI